MFALLDQLSRVPPSLRTFLFQYFLKLARVIWWHWMSHLALLGGDIFSLVFTVWTRQLLLVRKYLDRISIFLWRLYCDESSVALPLPRKCRVCFTLSFFNLGAMHTAVSYDVLVFPATSLSISIGLPRHFLGGLCSSVACFISLLSPSAQIL